MIKSIFTKIALQRTYDLNQFNINLIITISTTNADTTTSCHAVPGPKHVLLFLCSFRRSRHKPARKHTRSTNSANTASTRGDCLLPTAEPPSHPVQQRHSCDSWPLER